MHDLTLLQVRHSYAPPPEEELLGDTSLPNSLLNVQARLERAGVKATIIDHNVTPYKEPDTDTVGLTVLGMPYVPIVRSMVKKLLDEGRKVLVGGQLVDGLVRKDDDVITDRSQFDAFFDKRAIIGNDDASLAAALGIAQESLRPWKETSLVSSYEELEEASLRHYMSGDIPLELGQGCKKKCTFCGIAEKGIPTERWRDNIVIEKDLAWLAKKAQELGIETMNFYLTNVDLFQTPRRLNQFATIVERIKGVHQHVRLRFRGLSTVDEFLSVHDKHPEVIRNLVRAGLERLGAGVDGWSYDLWKSIGKLHNDETKCIRFVQIAREYGIDPEVLMVYGHARDTEVTMGQANDFLRWSVNDYGATPRPHYAKALIPGNIDWSMAVWHKDPRVDLLYDRPEFCQAMDFCARPSSLTDPDPEVREMKGSYFNEACRMPGTLTQYIEPMDPECSDEENARRMKKNKRKYDV